MIIVNGCIIIFIHFPPVKLVKVNSKPITVKIYPVVERSIRNPCTKTNIHSLKPNSNEREFSYNRNNKRANTK